MLCNLKCTKKGKPLFKPAAPWSLYRMMLNNIINRCKVGEDSMSMLIFKCICGGSTFKSFHQKIRWLIWGFNHFPRYAAVSLPHKFIYRWNHSIGLRILVLPHKYANYDYGWEVEQEIKLALGWSKLEEVLHPKIASMHDYASIGKTFGLNKTAMVSENEDNAEIDKKEIQELVDAMMDGSIEDSPESAKNVISSAHLLTESAQFVG
jgi:hypothetical protein